MSPLNETPAEAAIEDLVEGLRESMNALVICLSHSWGGLEQVAAHDALDVAALGLPVKVLCLEGSPIHEFLSRYPQVVTISLRFRPGNFLDLKFRAELRRLIDEEGVNLIHTHQTSVLGSISPWLWSRPQVALLASRHIMNGHDKRNLVHRLIYQRVDALVVMSHTLRQNVLDTHPLREPKVRVVNLGLDFERFDPQTVDPTSQRERWGADAETIVIGLVGRIDPAKGQATFLRAAAGLLKSHRFEQKIRFVLVGEETLGRASDHLKELKHLVKIFRLEDYVTFAGFQENIPEVMRAFDIFVMPSRQETFGLVAIEAMAMECPVVISNGGSAAEIVGQQEFGLLMRADDAFDLQRQLRWLIDQPNERKEMGRRAREHVRANYDKATRIRKTLELYERATRRRSRF